MRKTDRTTWLDGLRGVACVLVVACHWNAIFVGGHPRATWGAVGENIPAQTQWYRFPPFALLYTGGPTMVRIFFMISGFVLTRPALSCVHANDPYIIKVMAPTVFRRCLRLWLPTVVTQFIGLLLVRAGARKRLGPPKQDMSIIQEFGEFFQEIIRFLAPNQPVTGVHVTASQYEAIIWTIPIEYYGSYACFLLVLITSTSPYHIRQLLVALCVCASLVTKDYWMLTPFFLGIMFADFSLWKIPPVLKTWQIIPILGFAFYLASIHIENYFRLVPFPGNPVLTKPLFPFYDYLPPGIAMHLISTVSSTLFFYACFGSDFLQNLLNSTKINYLGRISFSLYLLHYAIFEALWPFYYRHVQYYLPIEDTIKTTLAMVLFWSFMGPLTLTLAHYHEQFIDRPSIALTRYIEDKVRA